MVMLGAANCDPLQFTNPDNLNIGRNPDSHLGFGWGPHYCIGALLARLEAQIVFDTILRRLPEFHCVEKKLTWRQSMAMRGLESLAIEFPQVHPRSNPH